jgi:hypothetical protein
MVVMVAVVVVVVLVLVVVVVVVVVERGSMVRVEGHRHQHLIRTVCIGTMC